MAANEHNLNQMTRAERFLLLHKELEAQIRRRLHLARNISYSELLNKMVESGDITVRENQNFLNSLRELRNILSHAPYGPGHIAEPSQEALEKFDAIVKRIARPPLMRDVASKPVKVFQETDTLLAALIDMKANDYSQIVIRRTGRLGLVTPEGITHWILRESDSVGLLEPAAASITHDPEHAGNSGMGSWRARAKSIMPSHES
jgi:hypothetical protein